MTKSLYGTSYDDILQWVEQDGEPAYRAKQLYEHLYTNRKQIDTISNWSKNMVADFKNDFSNDLEIETLQKSKDNTYKWLYRLHDGKFIETVLMLYPDRATVCISSQAGCAMGCTFCATGQAGFDRHLTSSEIVEQVARACHEVDVRVSNIVFMGMGEPMANLNNVYSACKTLIDDFGFSARHITVSTVGFIPGMKKMLDWDIPVTLAVSLHTPFNEMRNLLVPINKRYSIEDILKVAEDISHTHGRRVSFEYAAIDNKNITDECAHELGRLLGQYRGAGGAHLNVIPLNETKNFDGTPPKAFEIKQFSEIVESYGVTVTIRRNRGNDIDAACGQLRERVTSEN